MPKLTSHSIRNMFKDIWKNALILEKKKANILFFISRFEDA